MPDPQVPEQVTPPPEPASEPIHEPAGDSPPTSSFDLRAIAQEGGLDVSQFADDRDLANTLVASAQWYRENEPLTRYGREYVDHAAEFQQWRQEQEARRAEEAAKATKPTGPPPPDGWVEVPPFNEQWEKYTVYDPRRGAYVPNPEDPYASPRAAQERNAYEQAVRKNQSLLAQKGPQLFQQQMEQVLAQREAQILAKAQQQFQAALAYQRQIEQNQQYLNANAAKYYATDAQGNVLPADPRTGEPPLSQLGQALRHYAIEAQQHGMAPALIRGYAEAMANQYVAQQSAATPPPEPESSPPPPKQRFLDRIRNRANGSMAAPPEEHPNPDATLREIMDDELRKQGLLSQTG